MHEIGRRRRNQPAPPHVIFEALTELDRPDGRRWLDLSADEHRPRLLRTDAPSTVVWSSIWTTRPDAAVVHHLRRRLNVLINADLRYSFGQ